MQELECLTKFKILRCIATGGMGSIYLAEQLGTHGFKKKVVIKTIKVALVSDQEVLDMFIGEAKLVADLIHENIVQVYQFEQAEGMYFLIMEYAAGPNLDRFIQRHKFMNKNVPVDLAIYIISRIARGLAYIHKKRDRDGNRLKIVHRDISPSNIIITYQGMVKLIDFGIAKALTMKVPDEREVVMGKYPYMSPEQVRFEGTDPRSDIFSLGLVAYELLTGQVVYDVDDGMSLLRAMQQDIREPRLLNPDIPGPVNAIIMKSLAMDPQDRYRSAGEMKAALENLLYNLAKIPDNEKMARYVELLFPEMKKESMVR